MAAKTPDNVYRHNLGDLNLIRAVFSSTNIDDGDTWTSGITGYVDHWFSQQNDPSTNTSAGVAITQSGGVFTFYPGVDDSTGTLYVLVKS